MLKALVFVQSYYFEAKDRLTREDRGATAVEYGLLVGVIAVAIIATLVLIGPKLAAIFVELNTELDAV